MAATGPAGYGTARIDSRSLCGIRESAGTSIDPRIHRPVGRHMAIVRPTFTAGRRSRKSISSRIEFSATVGPWLAAGAAQEDVNQLIRQVAEALDQEKIVDLRDPQADGSAARPDRQRLGARSSNNWAVEPPTLFTSMQQFIQQRREIAGAKWPGNWTMRSSIRRSELSIGTASKNLRKSAAERAPPLIRLPSYANPKCNRRRQERPIRKPPSCNRSAPDLDKRFGRGCCFGRHPKKTWLRRWTARFRFPAGAISLLSRSSIGSTCWRPACGQ